MQTQSYIWGSRPPYIPNVSERRGYEVKSVNRIIAIGVAKARKARWSTHAQQSLPSENVAAIKLLDSWLSMPEIKDNDLGEGIRRRLDENRLSDRKFFT